MEAYVQALKFELYLWIPALVMSIITLGGIIWAVVWAWHEDSAVLSRVRRKIRAKAKYKASKNPSVSSETFEKELYEKAKKKHRKRNTRLDKWVVTAVGMFITVAFCFCVKGFVDICLDLKDKAFVVYYGEYEYTNYKRSDYAVLTGDNDKKINANSNKADGTYTGYVIYSCRSKVAVSFDEPIDEIK